MNLKCFWLIAAFVAITCAERRSDSNIYFEDGNIISKSKLINLLGRAEDNNNTITIQVKRNNAEQLDSEKLIGFVPVRSSRGDTYLIPKEAIQAIQKQYDAAGNNDGAILVPESIIELDGDELRKEEPDSNLIDKAQEISNLQDGDIIAVIQDPELLGRQIGQRRRQFNQRRTNQRRPNQRRPNQRRPNQRRSNQRGGNRRNENRRRFNRVRNDGVVRYKLSNGEKGTLPIRRSGNNVRRVVLNANNNNNNNNSDNNNNDNDIDEVDERRKFYRQRAANRRKAEQRRRAINRRRAANRRKAANRRTDNNRLTPNNNNGDDNSDRVNNRRDGANGNIRIFRVNNDGTQIPLNIRRI